MDKYYNIGFTAGIFDIFHIGHLETLKRAKERCNYLIVAVGTDEFLMWRKHRKPVMSYEERVEIIKAIKYVDKVVPETDLDKVKAYYDYHFDVMFAGDDHIDEAVYIEATKKLKELDVDTIYLPHLHEISSTLIREKIITMQK